MAFTAADKLAIGAIEAALQHARDSEDRRPALKVLAGSLVELGIRAMPASPTARLVADGRDAWLRRLRSMQRSESTIGAYRFAIDDLLAWAQREQRTTELFDEQTIVDYLDDYRQRCRPAPATYYRRFVLLRRFIAWLSRRHGIPDPFLELPAPPKPRQERDWLTPAEFAAMLAGAERPLRNRPGLVERDRLVLLALLMTGVRRSELIAARWADLATDGPHPSMLVRRGKGGKPRRQPLPSRLVAQLEHWRSIRRPTLEQPVFCGLAGRPMQPPRSRGSSPAPPPVPSWKSTSRRTRCATPQRRGCARPAAMHASSPSTSGTRTLSTVSRYAHVASQEMHDAVQSLADSTACPTRRADRPDRIERPAAAARRAER